MRRLILLAAIIGLTGCTKATSYGPCIGLNSKENPRLEYQYSAWNIGMGIIFIELIVPPIVVALDDLKCPIGYVQPTGN